MKNISLPPPVPPTMQVAGKFTTRHQKYSGLVIIIFGLALCGLGGMADAPSIVGVGWLLSGIGLALYAKGGGRSFVWGLFIGLGAPFFGPLIGLMVFARNKKIDPETGKGEERSLIFVVITTLIWALLDTFIFGSGVIAFILCIAGVLHFLPRAIAARMDTKLFKLRLSKAVITSAAGFAALGMVIHSNVIAREGAEMIVVAVEQYQTKYGRYPDRLEEIVPEYMPSIPKAKYVLGADSYRYLASGSKDSRHMLVYTVLPPFGRRIYTFEDHKWTTLD